MATELTISIKNSESRYSQKFLIYETYTFNETDPLIRKCLDEAKANFGRDLEIEDITIKAKLTL